jgi:hypothetical protein
LADPSSALGFLSGNSPLQDLDDDMVKLIGYNIVCLEYDNEMTLPKGEGTMMIVERMSREQFIAFAIEDWYEKFVADKTVSKEDREKVRKLDRRTLDVHWVVTRRWPRRDPKFDERKIEVLEQIAKVPDLAEKLLLQPKAKV